MEAQAYNKKLTGKSGDRFLLTDAEKKEYNSILNVTGTGIMGYVNIPKIGVSLPIYHGTDPAVLEIAVGHIEGSSLPVGGKGTHCVISGHRGLPSHGHRPAAGGRYVPAAGFEPDAYLRGRPDQNCFAG